MPNLTPRLSLQEPLGADNVSELRTAITTNATTLDSSVLYTEGTLVARPAANSVEHGRIYTPTDVGAVSRSNGTLWQPLFSMPHDSFGVSTTPNYGIMTQYVNGNTTATLPANQPGTLLGILAGVNVTGASPLTVSAGGSTINGKGCWNVGSITLGTPGSCVLLLSTNNAWYVISGQQDTGWVPITVGGPTWGPINQPSARLLGDQVYLRGSVQNITLGSISPSSQLGVIAQSNQYPRVTSYFPSVNENGVTWLTLLIFSDGRIDYANDGFGSIPAQWVISLEGITFPAH